MKILVYGIGKENPNYRKIEGFVNAFSKIGDTEWVSTFGNAKKNQYDIVFGELILDDILNVNLKKFLKTEIKVLNIWKTFDLNILKKIASIKPDSLIVNSYKSNILNKEIISEYIKKFGSKYQYVRGYDEGVNLMNFLNLDNQNLPKNLILNYLPCSLSEKSNFIELKKFDVAYFGTIRNRPVVEYLLKKLSKDFKIIHNYADKNKILNPLECFEYYKVSKITISQNVHPVILELPVRLGEATACGCRSFVHEDIRCNYKSDFLPNYTSTGNVHVLLSEIVQYLENFRNDVSLDLATNFSASYENVVNKICNFLKNEKVSN